MRNVLRGTACGGCLKTKCRQREAHLNAARQYKTGREECPMDNPFIWIWLGLVIVFCIFEACTTSLTTIWFAGGAMVAFVLALFKVPEWIQMVVFVVVSVALLVLTRSFVMKILKVGNAKTNIDSIIGQKATVVTDIDNSKDTGMVVVKGQKWSARAKDFDAVIPEGATVEIMEISGVKLIVSIISDKN